MEGKNKKKKRQKNKQQQQLTPPQFPKQHPTFV